MNQYYIVNSQKNLELSKFFFFLFYSFVFFLPHTKLSVPVLFNYEFTVADLIMMFLTLLSLITIGRISRKISPYLYAFIFFAFTILCSVVNAKSAKYFIAELLPYVFSFMIIITTLSFFTIAKDRIKVLSSIFNILLVTLLFTSLPVYFQMFTGQKFALFYDTYMWRYTFMCQNPNQFGVFVVLYSFLLLLMCIKFFPKRFYWVAISLLLFVPTALYCGSRTVAVVFAANLLLVGFIFIIRASWPTRVIVIPALFFFLAMNSTQLLDTIVSSTEQASRAMTIFDKFSDSSKDKRIVEGQSGISMEEAIVLFTKYPLTGVGLANKPMYSKFRTEIHNTFLKFLAETGIIGTLGFTIIFLFPPVILLFFNQNRFLIFIGLFFYLLFAAMNWPHMLFRQRWVWFFMVMYFLIARIKLNGKFSNNKLISN